MLGLFVRCMSMCPIFGVIVTIIPADAASGLLPGSNFFGCRQALRSILCLFIGGNTQSLLEVSTVINLFYK